MFMVTDLWYITIWFTAQYSVQVIFPHTTHTLKSVSR